eukprot:15247016-Alexandrium_andersonii.AAC.1
MACLNREGTQTLRMAIRTLALLVTQRRIAVALRVGGAEPLVRPTTRTAKGLPSRGTARLRPGARPNTRAVRTAPIPELVAHSQSRAASESRPGRLDGGVLR